jgi:hypothetical protein
MRPRFLLATTVAMGILNLTAFASLEWIQRFFFATLAINIFSVVVSYLVLWFFWKGRNWARLCVLVISFLSVINLLSLIHPHGIVIVYDSIVVAWAVLGCFLLYWLNLADVRDWFKSQKIATDSPNS